MKRLLALCLLLCLTLSGCRVPFSLPRAQEPKSTSIASVLGVKNGEGDLIQIFAASQGRNGTVPLRYEGQAESLTGALQDTRDQGEETVSYAHVEHILIEAETAQDRLPQLLGYCFQNGEQSIESNLWLLRDAQMESAFYSNLDLAKRLTTLKSSGEAGTSLTTRSLRETAAQLADGGAMLIPALRFQGEELVFDSYALFRDGYLVGYLEGDIARTTALLAGNTLYWTIQVETGAGEEGTVQLHSGGCSLKPVIRQGELKSLELTCDVDGTLTEIWSGKTIQNLHEQVKKQVEAELLEAMARLQELGADGANLRRQAGMGALWHWTILEQQWQEGFRQLPCQVTVRVRLTERF